MKNQINKQLLIFSPIAIAATFVPISYVVWKEGVKWEQNNQYTANNDIKSVHKALSNNKMHIIIPQNKITKKEAKNEIIKQIKNIRGLDFKDCILLVSDLGSLEIKKSKKVKDVKIQISKTYGITQELTWTPGITWKESEHDETKDINCVFQELSNKCKNTPIKILNNVTEENIENKIVEKIVYWVKNLRACTIRVASTGTLEHDGQESKNVQITISKDKGETKNFYWAAGVAWSNN